MKKLIGIILFATTFVVPVLACRYNVREIGFSDLTETRYQLNVYVEDATPAEFISNFRRISYAALADANMDVKMINIDQHPDQTSMDYLKQWRAEPPALILNNSAKRSLQVPLLAAHSIKESVWQTIEYLITSPVREKILANSIKSYCTVLLIEGQQADDNQQARKEIETAIRDMNKDKSQLPKPIAGSPKLVVVPAKARSDERVLLWSLGANIDYPELPAVAVIYGRARRMGPMLTDKYITSSIVYSLLYLIGADCECGLDRAWLLGTMIPTRWSHKMQSAVVNQLGFDPENPLVKTEFSQILSLNTTQQQQDENSLFGYYEGIVELEKTIRTNPSPTDNFVEIQESHWLKRFEIPLIIFIALIITIFIVALWISKSLKREDAS